MQPSNWQILVLKPTPAFLTFLSTQFNDAKIPEYRMLQTDNTAYVFPHQNSEEEFLDEIEAKYVNMFRHEIKRWLGEGQIAKDINASFLDFLCCFKFEVHTHLVLMEESLLDGNQMICIKPRTAMMKLIQDKLSSLNYGDDLVTQQEITQWQENGTVIVKNLPSVYDLRPFLRLQYYNLYETEMLRMCSDVTEIWPEVESYQMFCRYFVVEYHSQLLHLV
ncbi:MAG: hypothetical protein A3F18_08065 [Legionellales bacterium RIFCSPHIGHO2_12_FULL_37_14]|nr:MAG: hypothetical protein A3F18_08065 [Legionellales bacterium RIFCSPHIGHO2_12_FULL_37_14]